VYTPSDVSTLIELNRPIAVFTVCGPDIETVMNSPQFNDNTYKWYISCRDAIRSKYSYVELNGYDAVFNYVMECHKDNSKWQCVHEVNSIQRIFKGVNRDLLPLNLDFPLMEELVRERNVYVSPEYLKYGYRLSRALSYVSAYIPISDELITFVIDNSHNIEEFTVNAKNLGNWAKKYGYAIYPNKWFKYVNLELIIGYKSNLSDEEFSSQLEE